MQLARVVLVGLGLHFKMLSRSVFDLWVVICGPIIFATFAYFVLIYLLPIVTLKLIGAGGVPGVIVAQFSDIVAFVLFAALLLWIGRRWTGRAGWSPRHTLALITGALAFPILLTLLPFFWPTLEFVATIPFLVLLIALNLRLRRRERRLRGAHPPSDRSIYDPETPGWPAWPEIH